MLGEPALDRVHQHGLDRREVPHDLLGELDLKSVGGVSEDLVQALERNVLAETGRHATVDLQIRLRRDHVDLVRRVGHRRRQRHAEHRLEQDEQRRQFLSDLLDRRSGVRRISAEPLEHRRGRLGDIRRGLPLGQPREHRCELQQRVVSHPRQRRVPGHAARGQLEAEDALLAAAHAVAALAAELERGARALVQQQVATHLLGMLLAQPARADIAAGLLIGDEHEFQRAPGRPPPARAQTCCRDGFGRDLRLHVERAAAPEEAVVGDLPRPRVVGPLGRIREHRVDMAEIQERRAVDLAGQRRDEVRAVLVGGELLGLEAGCAQVLIEVLDRGPFVARRVDGVELDESAEDIGRLGLWFHRVQPTPQRRGSR
jgi:hypothetical protein